MGWTPSGTTTSTTPASPCSPARRRATTRISAAIADLAESFRNGYVYSWRYSRYRKRRHGNSSADRPARQFVVCSQNHDQIGNRLLGERLAGLVPFEALKLAAGAVLLSPYLPLLFMGEEYGEERPFLYFVSHDDPELVEAVREGHRQEFAAFRWPQEPLDPQDRETFAACRLDWESRTRGRHAVMLRLYRRLLELRRELPALARPDKRTQQVGGGARRSGCSPGTVAREAQSPVVPDALRREERVSRLGPPSPGRWRKLLDSSEERWDGQEPDCRRSWPVRVN